MLLNVCLWILVGGVIGMLAARLRLGTAAGVVGDMLAGVIGSLIGGIVTVSMLSSIPDGVDVASVVIAFLAALALIWLLHSLNLGERDAHRI